MKKLTAKFLHEKLKRNWTASDFSEYLGIPTDEFWSLLQKQFPGNSYKEFRILLQSNAKRSKRNKTADTFFADEAVNIPDTSSPNTSTEPTICPDDPEVQPTVANESQNFEPDNLSQAPEKSLPSLEELLAELEQLRDDLNIEELIHKAIVSERSEIRKALQEHNQAILDIRKILSQRQEDITRLLSQLDDAASRMSESTIKIQLLQEEKASLESKIEKARHVSIFIYNSGEVEVETQATIQFPEWEDLFNTIVNEEELTDLTIKQVKSLAKVIVLVRHLIAQDTPYEVFFENEISKNYFEKVIS